MTFILVYSILLLLVFFAYTCMIAGFTFGLFKLSGSPVNRFNSSLSRHFNSRPTQDLPKKVSVIIPVRNEAATIVKCLEGLWEQDYQEMEIIITDDFSEDYTLELVHRFARQNSGFPLVIVDGKSSQPGETGKKRAIERAIVKASGAWIITTDADTHRDAQWISSMMKRSMEFNGQMLLGPVAFCNERTFLQKLQTLEFLGLMGVTAGSSQLGYPVMCNGANLAYRKEAFLSVGGFTGNTQHFSGDDQFLLAAIRKRFGGGAIRFHWDKQALVTTEPEKSWKGFVAQRIRWVSKSHGYREPAVVTVSLLTYMIHFLLLTGFVLGAFFLPLLIPSSALWLGKILAEYPMVRIMARFMDKRQFLGYYFVAQVFQLFYIVIIGVSGQILPYRWKGRTSGRWQ